MLDKDTKERLCAEIWAKALLYSLDKGYLMPMAVKLAETALKEFHKRIEKGFLE